MQTRDFIFKAEEMKSNGYFRGIASTADLDSHGDIIEAGAFKKSLSEARPKLLWQHKMDEPIGRITNIAETDNGLEFEAQLNLDITRGKEAYFMLKHGDIDGISIGFAPVKGKYDYDNKNGGYRFKEVRLFEVSVVTLPANVSACVTTVKGEMENLSQLTVAQRELVMNFISYLMSLNTQEPEQDAIEEALQDYAEEQDEAEDATPFELLAAVAKQLNSTAGQSSNEPLHSEYQADLDELRKSIGLITQKGNNE